METELIAKNAHELAARVLSGDVRSDGTPFILHPEGTARIVSDEIGLGAECVAAVYIHEALRMHPDTEIPKGMFPDEVMAMAEGLGKISTIKPKDTRLEAENYKKLIVQYSADPRVVVLKIADRLEVMRNLDIFPKQARERKVLETLMLYIPLAHQLGLYNIKSEMEDIWLKFSEPEQYRLINNKLKATEKDRTALMEDFIEPLKQKLSEAGIAYKLKIRTKSAYSIFRKMNAQKVPFEGVFDVFAIRFIIDCEDDPAVEKDLCWKVYSYVTEEYEPDTSRLRDWLSNPKPNGYESLHITVKNRSGTFLEVQIRSRRMDDEAENGQAAHWSYKGIRHEKTLDRWLLSVRHALENPGHTKEEDLPLPPEGDIFVFTPSGELRILPKGATVLDFAFNIHTNIGLHCTGGRIGGRAVSIREKLSTGDVVEILTGRNQKPSADWMDFVVSSKARNKIKQTLHEAEFSTGEQGRELLERRLKNWKLTLTDEQRAEFIRQHKLQTIGGFYAALGSGEVDVNTVKSFILAWSDSSQEARTDDTAKRQWTASEGGRDDILVINSRNLKGLDYKMARCCNPVYGDDVFGFVTRDAGIKIHRMSCPNAARLMEMYPYRIQKVRWSDSPASGSFQTTLRITTEIDPSAISSVIDTVAQFKASMRTFSFTENARNGTYEVVMNVSVPSDMELDKVLSKLRLLRTVIRARRS